LEKEDVFRSNSQRTATDQKSVRSAAVSPKDQFIMDFDNAPILFVLFAVVVGIPILSLTKMVFFDPPSGDKQIDPREPRMPDAAYPSTWLKPGWNRKFLKAPLQCDSLMELYTTSVRLLRERNWNLGKSYTERCLAVLAIKGLAAPDLELEANLANNLGVVDFYIGSANQARAYFEKALNLATAAAEDVTVTSSALNLCAVLVFQNELKAAQEALNQAREAIVRLDGTESRNLVDVHCLQKAIDNRAMRGR
jgi:hypothetical protein